MLRIATTIALLVLFAASVSPLTAAQTSEQDVVKRYGASVVAVTAALTLTWATFSGGTTEQQITTNATVIDTSGLAVMSLSQLEPGVAFTDGPPIATAIRDLKMIGPQGEAVPARVVLRDQELDLAFIKPASGAAGGFTAVPPTSSAPALLATVICLQRAGSAFGWALGASRGHVQLIIDSQPRFYVPAWTPLGGVAFGCPVFDSHGGFVGVTVLRSPGRPDRIAAVLPGDVIRAIARENLRASDSHSRSPYEGQ